MSFAAAQGKDIWASAATARVTMRYINKSCAPLLQLVAHQRLGSWSMCLLMEDGSSETDMALLIDYCLHSRTLISTCICRRMRAGLQRCCERGCSGTQLLGTQFWERNCWWERMVVSVCMQEQAMDQVVFLPHLPVM